MSAILSSLGSVAGAAGISPDAVKTAVLNELIQKFPELAKLKEMFADVKSARELLDRLKDTVTAEVTKVLEAQRASIIAEIDKGVKQAVATIPGGQGAGVQPSSANQNFVDETQQMIPEGEGDNQAYAGNEGYPSNQEAYASNEGYPSNEEAYASNEENQEGGARRQRRASRLTRRRRLPRRRTGKISRRDIMLPPAPASRRGVSRKRRAASRKNRRSTRRRRNMRR